MSHQNVTNGKSEFHQQEIKLNEGEMNRTHVNEYSCEQHEDS